MTEWIVIPNGCEESVLNVKEILRVLCTLANDKGKGFIVADAPLNDNKLYHWRTLSPCHSERSEESIQRFFKAKSLRMTEWIVIPNAVRNLLLYLRDSSETSFPRQ